MKKFSYIFKVFFFWMLFFLLMRIGFIAYNISLFHEASIQDILFSLVAALRLDVATACYLTLPSLLVYTLYVFLPKKFIAAFHLILAFFLLFFSLSMTLANLLLYKEWQALLSMRALSFLRYPKEVLASLSGLYIFVSLLLFAGLLGLLCYAWKKWLSFPAPQKDTLFSKIILLPLFISLLFIGVRGGWQLIPINESSAYSSTISAVNHAAVNPLWYLGNSIYNEYGQENNYHFMSDEKAEAMVDSLYAFQEKTCPEILAVERPNVIFIVLESHTASVIQSLGGDSGICPSIEKLTQEGILFRHIYGSGSRTDQGLVSILSAFPAQPDRSIIKYTSKVQQLPSLISDLKAAGYNTSFYYGGELEFANISAYLQQSGIEKVSDKRDYNSNQINSKWGAHDEYVLQHQLDELIQVKQPFFSMLLTLSNHEPFETPQLQNTKNLGDADRFRIAASYTDRCLGNYFERLKKTEFYSKTLFVIVADHGHHLPHEVDMNLPESKHIPLLLLGGALKDSLRGSIIDCIGNQEDIAATLLYQLHLPHEKYNWSKNLLAPAAPNFAYYSNQNVLGWIGEKDTLVYSFVQKQNIHATTKIASEEMLAKAYLQKMYKKFSDL